MCTKTAAQITLLQHRRPSSCFIYRFIWSVKPCWHASRVNLLENRSLYWDIHQSHHCGLPDAATAHQDIRYWKLTGGFGDNKNISHDVSNVSRSEAAVFDAWGYNYAAMGCWVFFFFFWRQKTCDFGELEFTGNLFRWFVENFQSCGECERLHRTDPIFHTEYWINCCTANCYSFQHVSADNHLKTLEIFW